ncbi:uncharacterized protein EI90DRAFT_2396868 [Cantharellus anzutake]|uniref:uncharacterized protein n=1 Tax=Cantharellus anzutake TaxID=1750568 RepID=UPI00190321DE|nr:uncharacterized protein EI90DRAFT_2396868 [Cantharellus anzutake]KAF8322896.1 hypothetical protein EI90DRAFT_2396868 [Cantharellus anzutake]
MLAPFRRGTQLKRAGGCALAPLRLVVVFFVQATRCKGRSPTLTLTSITITSRLVTTVNDLAVNPQNSNPSSVSSPAIERARQAEREQKVDHVNRLAFLGTLQVDTDGLFHFFRPDVVLSPERQNKRGMSHR